MIRSFILAGLVLVAVSASTAFGQGADKAIALAGEKTAANADSVQTGGIKGKVFEIKYCNPRALLPVIKPLASGMGRATMSFSDEFKTITVRDYAENIAVIEDAINRLDRSAPENTASPVDFYIYVLIGSNGPLEGAGVPKEMAGLVDQLGAALHYKNYALMSSSLERSKEGIGLNNAGVADPKVLGPTSGSRFAPVSYRYDLRDISVNGAGPGAAVQVQTFDFRMKFPIFNQDGHIDYQDVGFNTPITTRVDQQSVVGSTTIGDKGVIVVLMARAGK